ncbi:MAG: PAS domain-containing protein [Pseudomonadota bacterium]
MDMDQDLEYRNFIGEIDRLIHSLERGDFGWRCNDGAFSGTAGKTLGRLNETMAMVSSSLMSVSECISRISLGDVPDRLPDVFTGEFRSITSHLNGLIRGLNEIAVTSVLISSGTIDDLEFTERSGNDRTLRAFNLLIKRLRDILDVIDKLILGVQSGDLRVRGNADQFSGVWRDLVVNINTLMEQLLSSVQGKRQSEESFRNLFESAPDGILLTGFDGELISFNPAAMKIFQYDDPREFAGLRAQDLYRSPETDRPVLLAKLREQGFIDSYTLVFKDRNNEPFFGSLSVRIIRHEGRECLQSILRDITGIMEMESRLRDYAANLEQMVDEKTRHLQEANEALSATVKTLEETREQLARKSYEAGLAEMAVSVLHNIGNAITPVNIRIGMMLESPLIDPSITRSLHTVQDLLQDPESLDPSRVDKAARIVAVISRLLSGVNTGVENDLNFILKNINHIREIIFRQQRYAGVYGSEAPVDVNELLADSVEMLRDSIDKRGISLECNFGQVPSIHLDKNKMLQIFVNILKNAYEAIDMATATQHHHIVLCTATQENSGRVFAKICFKDTGIGIDPEVRQKMFTYQFSTKKRLSGFGLHDSANYIRDKNGTIECSSKGKDQGARIIVTLPIET